MKFSTLKSSVLLQFSQENGHLVVPFITGQPGGGKSACAREIAKELQAKFDIPDDRVVEFNPSLRDRWTSWAYLSNLKMVRIPSGFLRRSSMRFVQAKALLSSSWKKMSDAGMAMQNVVPSDSRPLCSQMKLSEQLFIIATGNRVEDKSAPTV